MDLYVKMLIGTFSFIGPSFSLLIPIYYQAILRSREKHFQVMGNLHKVFLDTRNNETSAKDQQQIFKSFQRLLHENTKELRLLNPKRQLRRLFFSLFFAIALMLFYYYQASVLSLVNDRLIGISTVTISVVSFCYCLMVLWQMFCTIITIKEDDNQHSYVKLKPNSQL